MTSSWRAIAIWRAYGGGIPSWGDFEAARRRAAALGVQAAIGPRYFVGVDLGQSRDPTAIAVVRRVELADPAAAAEAGRSPEPTYARGCLEWQRQQERNDADRSPAKRGQAEARWRYSLVRLLGGPVENLKNAALGRQRGAETRRTKAASRTADLLPLIDAH